MTQIWYLTICHQKLHPYTKFGIPTFNNIRYMLRTRFFYKLGQVKVTVIHKWYKTPHHPKMHSHTKIEIPISINIRDMLQTQLLLKLGQGHSDPKMVSDTPPSQDAYTHQIWNSYLKEYKRYAPNTIILKTRSKVKVPVTKNGM